MPRWSTDGTKLAFYSTRGGKAELWLKNLRTDSTQQITNLEAGIDPDPVVGMSGWYRDALRYSWSPDGNKIVFTSRADLDGAEAATHKSHLGDIPNQMRPHLPANGTPIVLTSTTPTEIWQMYKGLFKTDWEVTAFPSSEAVSADHVEPLRTQTNQLFIVDTDTRQVHQLTHDGQGYFHPDWSHDGKQILCASTEGRAMGAYGPDTSNIYAIDIIIGHKTAVTSGAGQKRLPHWSPDGKWIAYIGGEQYRASHVLVLPTAGGQPVKATTQLDRNVSKFYWSPDSQSVLVSYQDGVSWPIARLNVASGTVQTLTTEDAFHDPFTVSPTGDLIWVQSDGSSTGVIYQANQDGSGVRGLVDLNPQIQQWTLGAQEVIRWKNGRGEDLQGILIKPVGYMEGKSYPLIVDPYPGLVNGFAAGPMNGNQAFASEGYAVFFPRERTAHTWENPTRGEDFDQATRGPAGADIMMDDLTTGIDAVIKWVSPIRIECVYMALAMEGEQRT